jgi:biotin-dependent carboxylase-like uncharacterized protein
MRSLLVLNPGAMTTIQDLGRIGYSHLGIPQSGVIDQEAASIANKLLGNPVEAAVLECTVVGPCFAILKTVQLAIAGADMGATLNFTPIPNLTAFTAKAGDVLTFGQIKSGCRAYLAIGGGFNVPMIMGSLSTYIDGKLGGFKGRALLKGDYLSPFEYRSFNKPITIAQLDQPRYSSQVALRVLDGPQFAYFGSNVQRFFQGNYLVSDKTNRTGCCLDGPSVSTVDGYHHTIISEPVVRGNIQVPPNGKPIVLWSEQTVGSYAKIATVITPDLPLLAQAIPGDKIYFRRIDLNTAHILYRKWHADHIRSIG